MSVDRKRNADFELEITDLFFDDDVKKNLHCMQRKITQNLNNLPWPIKICDQLLLYF